MIRDTAVAERRTWEKILISSTDEMKEKTGDNTSISMHDRVIKTARIYLCLGLISAEAVARSIVTDETINTPFR